MSKVRIFFTGVGGQGTLTATILLAQAAMAKGVKVTAGEVHGMAQRGGVVESTLLLGGFMSPRISFGEADVLLGFEPLETLRALAYPAKTATIVGNSEPIPPIGVTMGRETYPNLDDIQAKAEKCAKTVHFLPCQTLGLKAGSVQSGNVALLGALCALKAVPLSLADLAKTIKARMRPKLVDMNITALELGAATVG